MRRGLVVLLLAGSTERPRGSPVGSQASTKRWSGGTSVTIANVAGQSWTCNFNPFNSTVQFLSFGSVYEELVFVNGSRAGSRHRGSPRSTPGRTTRQTLTFTIRNGVKWSDGKPLTAADVLFTFQLLKKNPGLDLQRRLVGPEERGARKGRTRSSSTSSPPRRRYFFYVADQTPIVPKHIWSKGAAAKTRSSTRTRSRSAAGPTP